MARILAKSRKNNARRQIVGGLLFGDGCFLQCLEGEAQAIETLYERIESDRRHRDVTVLSRQPISQRSFGAWSMKYVPGEDSLRDTLRAWGATRFDPYSLTTQQVSAAVELMREEVDAVNTLPSELDDCPARNSVENKPDRIVSRLKPSSGVGRARTGASSESTRTRQWLGVVVIVTLIVGAVAFWKSFG